MQPLTGIQARLKSSGAADAMDYVAHCTDGDGYHIEEPVGGGAFIISEAKSTHTGKYKAALVSPL